MRMRTRGLAALTAVVLVGTGAEASAALITGVSVQEASSQLSDYGRLANNVVNGSGLSTNVLGQTVHDSLPDRMWLTRGNAVDQGPADPHVSAADGQLAHIVFNLGESRDVSSFRVWNYNELPGTSVWTLRGAQSVRISVADTAGGTFTTVTDPADAGTTFTFLPAPGTDGYTGQLFEFTTAVSGQFIRFDILANYGGGNSYTGLSEVQFDAPIPEPAGLALLGLAGGAALLRRRRR
jgi:hypothetical protein